jgi:hypothetical protein
MMTIAPLLSPDHVAASRRAGKARGQRDIGARASATAAELNQETLSSHFNLLV